MLPLNLMNLDHLVKNLYNSEPGWDEFNCYSIYDKILLGTRAETQLLH